MGPDRCASNEIDASTRTTWRRVFTMPCATHLVTLAAAAVLVGCGGGVAIGFGGGENFDSSPPSVSIAASSLSVAAGQQVTLIAAASDESGIDAVAFYRLDPGEQRVLGTLARPPYTLSVTAPSDGRSVMQVFARAIDNVGKRADSQIIDIAISR